MSLLVRLRTWLTDRAAQQAECRQRELRRQLYPDFYITSLEHRRVFNAAPLISPQSFDVDESAALGAEVAYVDASDPDPGDSVSFAITAGNTGGTFTIDPATGLLTVADNSALATESAFALTIEVTDPLGQTDSATITINVNPSAANARPLVNDQRFVVPWDSSNGTVVGTVAATDADPGDSLTYSITAGDASGAFAIDPNTGQITIADASQLGVAETRSITVRVEDPGAAFDEATIVIQLNAPPTDIELSDTAVNENDAAAVVGSLSITDANADDQFTLTVDDVRFEVVGGDLKLKAGQALDFEATSSVVVTVTVTDRGGATYDEQFTIDVTDLNESPTAVVLDNSDLAENSPGTSIGVVTVTDEDADGTPYGSHSFDVLEDYGAGFVASTRFEVVSGTLRLKAGQALNHEVEPSVVIRIRATDGGGAAAEQQFTLTVIDQNETITDITLSAATIAENSAGAVIGTVSAEDPDDPAEPFGTATWEALEDLGAGFVTSTRFEVVGGQLKLKAGQQLNHESEPSVNLRVRATDGGGLAYSEDFTITVDDVNEAPTAIAIDNQNVPENDAGAVIGSVSVTDADDAAEPFGTHAFVVQEDYGAGFVTSTRFEIDGGQLRLKAGVALDHEAEPSVIVRVRATDGGGLAHEQDFTINVDDVNETPSDIALGGQNVAELSPGAVVGTVTVTDADDAAETFGTHAFVVQEDYGAGFVTSTRFEVVGGQLKLKAGQQLNHEAEPTVSLRVRATDGGGLAYSEDFTITVDDVNEAPTAIAIDNQNVPENDAGALIGSVSVADADDAAEPFGTHAFVVQEDYGAGFVTSTRFEIVGGQLRLKAGVALDHEAEPSVIVRVRATDGGGLAHEQDFTINVDNVNETPTDIGLAGQNVAELSPGAVVGTVTVTDADDAAEPFGTHSFVVQEDYGAGFVTSTRFEIVGGQLKLKAGQQLNHEAEPTISVRVLTTDGGGLSRTENFTITVEDVNEAPTNIAIDNQSVDENDAGALIGSVTVTDADDAAEPFGTHSYVVQENYGGGFVTSTRFEIVGGQLRLKPGVALDRELESSVLVRVRATDGGGLVYARNFTITVLNVNELPSATTNDYNTTEDDPAAGNIILDDTGAGADSDIENDVLSVAAINGSAASVGQTITLASGALLHVASNGAFTYDPTTSAQFQSLATGDLFADTFTYTVSDGNGGTSVATVTLHITGTNDSPLVAPSAVAAGTEDTARSFTHAQLLALLGATDADDAPNDLVILITDVQNAVYSQGDSLGTLYTFTPLANFNGAIEFTYQVRDNENAFSVIGSGTIAISPVNDGPSLAIAPLLVAEDGTSQLSLALDSGYADVETPVTAAIFQVVTSSAHLSASIHHATQVLTITATTLNYNGPAAVVVRVTDLGDGISPALTVTQTVAVTVVPVNDAPTTVNDSRTLAEDPPAPVSGNVLINDFDVDANPALNLGGAINDLLPNSVDAHPSVTVNPDGSLRLNHGGTLHLSVDGTYTYKPAENFFGTEVLRYRVRDSLGAISVGTLTLHVTPVNDAPTFLPPAMIEIDPAHTNGALLTAVLPGPPNESGQHVSFAAHWNLPGVLPLPSITPHPTLANAWQILFTDPPFENRDLLLTIVATDDGGMPGVDHWTRVVPVHIVVSLIPVNTAPAASSPPPEFTSFVVTLPYLNAASAPPPSPTSPLIAAASAESSTQSQRAVEVYLVPADGSEALMDAPILVLPPELLNDLKRLFRELPDDRYRIFLRLEDGTRKQVLDIYVRDGRPFDPGETLEELVIPVPDAEAPTAAPAIPDEAVPPAEPTVAASPLGLEITPEPSHDSQPANHTGPASQVVGASAGMILLTRAEHQRAQRTRRRSVGRSRDVNE